MIPDQIRERGENRADSADSVDQAMLTELFSQLPSWKALLAGASAGLIQDAILHPIDTLRARLQVNSHGLGAVSPWRALASVASQTLRREGLRGLYGGYSTVWLFS